MEPRAAPPASAALGGAADGDEPLRDTCESMGLFPSKLNEETDHHLGPAEHEADFIGRRHPADALWESSAPLQRYRTAAFHQFVDPATQRNFVDFKAMQFGKRFFTPPISALMACAFVAYWIFTLRTVVIGPGAVAFALSCLAVLSLLAAVTYFKHSHSPVYSGLRREFLENSLMLAIVASLGLIVIIRVTSRSRGALLCHDGHPAPNGVPDLLLVVTFVPLLCSLTLPAVGSHALLAAYVWVAFVHAFVDGTLRSIDAVPWQAAQILLLMSVHLITSWTKVQSFLLFERIKDMQHQREEEAEHQTHEKRKLIGKVAHDVRTPLVAFRYGLDVMEDCLVRMREVCPALGLALRHALPATAALRRPLDTSAPAIPVLTPVAVVHPTDAPVNQLTVDQLAPHVRTWTEALEGLQQSHQQLMVMINRCLDYNKLSLGAALVPTYAPAAISGLVALVLDHARRALDGCDVRVEAAEGSEFLVTDPGWLHDNLLCLISNAIRFSPPNMPVWVRFVRYVRSSLSGDAGGAGGAGELMLRFEVEDFGVGVAPERKESLFLAPECGAERSMGGTGLGLYCLAERVKALRGEFGVRLKAAEQVLDQDDPTAALAHHGSVFWFALPLPESSQANSPHCPQRCLSRELKEFKSEDIKESGEALCDEGSRNDCLSQIAAAPDDPRACGMPPPEQLPPSVEERLRPDRDHPSLAAQLQRLRVLVVDDSPLILKMLKMMFVGKGHDVVTTPSAIEGLALLRESFLRYLDCVQQSQPLSAWAHFDAVLIDIQMPIMDGLEMMRQYEGLRAELAHLTDRGLPWPVIVAMSANTDPVTMRDAYSVGAHHFLCKPFDLDTFCAVFVRQRERPM